MTETSTAEMESKLMETVNNALKYKAENPYNAITGEYYDDVVDSALEAVNSAKRGNVVDTLHSLMNMGMSYKDYVWMVPDSEGVRKIRDNFIEMMDVTFEICSQILSRCVLPER